LALWTFVLANWAAHSPGEPEPLKSSATLLILTGLAWLTACYLLPRLPHAPRWLVLSAAALAAAIRLISWQVPPVFSDDLLRYRWEGRIQAHGENPYAVRPVDRPSLLHADDDRLPGRDFKAVYGPLVLLTERLAYQVSGENLLLLRWPFALADLLTLLVLARRFGLRAIVVYGWCPLAAFEFWSGGHNDSLCLLALALTIIAFDEKRDALGWIALGAAILTKWWPALLIPFFLTQGRWRRLPWIAVPSLLLTPLYWTNPTENAQFASGFVGGWRNNDSLFGALLALTGDLYRAKYTAFACTASVALWLVFRKTAPAHKIVFAITGLLLFSANVHPWYLTWLLPFLVQAPAPHAFLWIALAPIAFEPAILWRTTGVWNGVVPSRWFLYSPVFAVLLFAMVPERWYHGRRKEQRF
jgi:hypothetical protein